MNSGQSANNNVTKSLTALWITALWIEKHLNDVYKDIVDSNGFKRYELDEMCLSHIDVYDHPGDPEHEIPAHWHYISYGISYLDQDQETTSDYSDRVGFELTFRLKKGDLLSSDPPRWPLSIILAFATYIQDTGNILSVGDHIPWNQPLDQEEGDGDSGSDTQQNDTASSSLIQHLLVAEDPELMVLNLPNSLLQFRQLIGVLEPEIKAAQSWKGCGLLDLLSLSPVAGGIYFITDMTRDTSVFDQQPYFIRLVGTEIASAGSNLAHVTALCSWEGQCLPGVNPAVIYDHEGQPIEEHVLQAVTIHIDTEAAELLPIAARGRLAHGRYFLFESLRGEVVLFIPAGCDEPMVSVDLETPLKAQGPALQIFCNEDFIYQMAEAVDALSYQYKFSSMTREIHLSYPNVTLVIRNMKGTDHVTMPRFSCEQTRQSPNNPRKNSPLSSSIEEKKQSDLIHNENKENIHQMLVHKPVEHQNIIHREKQPKSNNEQQIISPSVLIPHVAEYNNNSKDSGKLRSQAAHYENTSKDISGPRNHLTNNNKPHVSYNESRKAHEFHIKSQLLPSKTAQLSSHETSHSNRITNKPPLHSHSANSSQEGSISTDINFNTKDVDLPHPPPDLLEGLYNASASPHSSENNNNRHNQDQGLRYYPPTNGDTNQQTAAEPSESDVRRRPSPPSRTSSLPREYRKKKDPKTVQTNKVTEQLDSLCRQLESQLQEPVTDQHGSAGKMEVQQSGQFQVVDELQQNTQLNDAQYVDQCDKEIISKDTGGTFKDSQTETDTGGNSKDLHTEIDEDVNYLGDIGKFEENRELQDSKRIIQMRSDVCEVGSDTRIAECSKEPYSEVIDDTQISEPGSFGTLTHLDQSSTLSLDRAVFEAITGSGFKGKDKTPDFTKMSCMDDDGKTSVLDGSITEETSPDKSDVYSGIGDDEVNFEKSQETICTGPNPAYNSLERRKRTSKETSSHVERGPRTTSPGSVQGTISVNERIIAGFSDLVGVNVPEVLAAGPTKVRLPKTNTPSEVKAAPIFSTHPDYGSAFRPFVRFEESRSKNQMTDDVTSDDEDKNTNTKLNETFVSLPEMEWDDLQMLGPNLANMAEFRPQSTSSNLSNEEDSGNNTPTNQLIGGREFAPIAGNMRVEDGHQRAGVSQNLSDLSVVIEENDYVKSEDDSSSTATPDLSDNSDTDVTPSTPTPVSSPKSESTYEKSEPRDSCKSQSGIKVQSHKISTRNTDSQRARHTTESVMNSDHQNESALERTNAENVNQRSIKFPLPDSISKTSVGGSPKTLDKRRRRSAPLEHPRDQNPLDESMGSDSSFVIFSDADTSFDPDVSIPTPIMRRRKRRSAPFPRPDSVTNILPIQPDSRTTPVRKNAASSQDRVSVAPGSPRMDLSSTSSPQEMANGVNLFTRSSVTEQKEHLEKGRIRPYVLPTRKGLSQDKTDSSPSPLVNAKSSHNRLPRSSQSNVNTVPPTTPNTKQRSNTETKTTSSQVCADKKTVNKKADSSLITKSSPSPSSRKKIHQTMPEQSRQAEATPSPSATHRKTIQKVTESPRHVKPARSNPQNHNSVRTKSDDSKGYSQNQPSKTKHEPPISMRSSHVARPVNPQSIKTSSGLQNSNSHSNKIHSASHDPSSRRPSSHDQSADSVRSFMSQRSHDPSSRPSSHDQSADSVRSFTSQRSHDPSRRPSSHDQSADSVRSFMSQRSHDPSRRPSSHDQSADSVRSFTSQRSHDPSSRPSSHDQSADSVRSFTSQRSHDPSSRPSSHDQSADSMRSFTSQRSTSRKSDSGRKPHQSISLIDKHNYSTESRTSSSSLRPRAQIALTAHSSKTPDKPGKAQRRKSNPLNISRDRTHPSTNPVSISRERAQPPTNPVNVSRERTQPPTVSVESNSRRSSFTGAEVMSSDKSSSASQPAHGKVHSSRNQARMSLPPSFTPSLTHEENAGKSPALTSKSSFRAAPSQKPHRPHSKYISSFLPPSNDDFPPPSNDGEQFKSNTLPRSKDKNKRGAKLHNSSISTEV